MVTVYSRLIIERVRCRAGHKRAENIESLFLLYDALESSCQETLKSGRTGDQKDNATAAQLLEELRVRFVRLVGISRCPSHCPYCCPSRAASRAVHLTALALP